MVARSFFVRSCSSVLVVLMVCVAFSVMMALPAEARSAKKRQQAPPPPPLGSTDPFSESRQKIMPILGRLCTEFVSGEYLPILSAMQESSAAPKTMMEQRIECNELAGGCGQIKDTWDDFSYAINYLQATGDLHDLVSVDETDEKPYLYTSSHRVDALYLNTTFVSAIDSAIPPVRSSVVCLYVWNDTRLERFGVRTSLQSLAPLIPGTYHGGSLEEICTHIVDQCQPPQFMDNTTPPTTFSNGTATLIPEPVRRCASFLDQFRVVDYDGIPRKMGDSVMCRSYWFQRAGLDLATRCNAVLATGQQNIYCRDPSVSN